MSTSSSGGVKSAYERALERLAEDGIEKPREGALSASTRDKIRELRERASAKLAELEILHRDHRSAAGAGERQKAENDYVAERERIESKRDREIERLRKQGS